MVITVGKTIIEQEIGCVKHSQMGGLLSSPHYWLTPHFLLAGMTGNSRVESMDSNGQMTICDVSMIKFHSVMAKSFFVLSKIPIFTGSCQCFDVRPPFLVIKSAV